MKFLIIIFVMICYLRYYKIEFDEHKWSNLVKNQDKNLLYSKNVKNNKFYNPWIVEKNRFFKTIKWLFEKKEKDKNDFLDEYFQKVNIELVRNLIDKKQDFYIWLGHNSSLIYLEDNFYLVDPNFDKSIFIEKRQVPLPIELSTLNEILENKKVSILITHAHYDHLSINTLKNISSNFELIIPKNLRKYLLKRGINFKNIVELDWWNNYNNINFVPASHYSSRIDLRKNSTLWGSYIISLNNRDIFIGGDSSYFIGFKEIGNKYNIDLAILPVGGYETRWYAYIEHLNVEESLEVYDDLKTNSMFVTHWGTFKLGDEGLFRTPTQIEKLRQNKNIKINKIGEVVKI